MISAKTKGLVASTVLLLMLASCIGVQLWGIYLDSPRWFWIFVILVTFAPFLALWLNALCGFTQHVGLSSNVPDFRLNCRTVILSPPVRFLYSYMNYHVEHHMYAAVPFYNLPKLRKAIEHDLPAANRSLWAAWKEILPILKRQKKDPDYVWVPALPHGSAEGRPAPA